MKELISVIVPIYKVEEYLPQCIDSILKQTYTNIEVILIDDGSPDGCPELCDRYAQRDSRIKVIHQINCGLSGARNNGIREASGEFITFVDSDDMVHPEYLEVLYRTAKEKNADLACCHYVSGTECNWTEKAETIELREGKDVLDRINDDDVVVTVVWNKLYRTEVIKGNDIRFVEGKINEDMYFTPRVLCCTERMAITSRELYFYRVRDNSIMTSSFSPKKLDILDAIEFRIELFKSLGRQKILTQELENYIRKGTQLVKYIKNSDNTGLEHKELKQRVIHCLRQNKGFLAVSLKYKVKYILLLIA